MVRSIVGLLLDVGRAKRAPADVAATLAARDRAAASPIAPARGLHLVGVSYPKDPFVRAS
jgi:tRNA pseudouridine38-40 synthase